MPEIPAAGRRDVDFSDALLFQDRSALATLHAGVTGCAVELRGPLRNGYLACARRLRLQRRQAPFDRRSLDDGRAGDGVLRERFKNIIHLLDRMNHEAS